MCKVVTVFTVVKEMNQQPTVIEEFQAEKVTLSD